MINYLHEGSENGLYCLTVQLNTWEITDAHGWQLSHDEAKLQDLLGCIPEGVHLLAQLKIDLYLVYVFYFCSRFCLPLVLGSAIPCVAASRSPALLHLCSAPRGAQQEKHSIGEAGAAERSPRCRVRGQTDARGIVSHNTYTNDHWTSEVKGLVNNMKNFQPSFDYMEICLWCIRVIIYWPTVFSNFSVSIKITTPSIRKSLSHEWLYVASSGRYIHLRNKLFRIEGVYDVIDQYH